MFILRLLKLYEISQPEESCEVSLKPSLVEIAFDFHDHEPNFLFKLTSSIYSRKKHFGWINNRDSALNAYDEGTEDLWLNSSHYIGKRTDKNYRTAVYNKFDFTRLEFRLEHKGLHYLKIGCVEDLFTKNWISDLLYEKRIKFIKPNEEAFERVDSSYHYLAKVSLKEFVSKVPESQKDNLLRDAFDKNDVLRKVLEASAIEFHDWVDYQYQNTCLMVITKEGLKVEDDDYEDFFEDPNTSERNRVSPAVDLKSLFRLLPEETTVETQEHESYVRFTLRDNQSQILAHIIVGELPERLVEYGDRYIIEKFSDVLKKPQINI